MSTTVDERVVEMRFDNRQFENNVSTTMSTLDKLKQKLNLSGASKGLEDVNSAVKKVDMSALGTSVETVQAKFSALQVMGVTALANITNSAVNAGKRMVESLTVAPVKDGFSEYEMTLNAVQTTMAGTGKTAAEVQAELKKLDEYADKTVYSTADMLNNLPKFTNAGVELEDATKAMIGIANATALAGGDAGKASIAFYNLGQAIGTGYLTRMDYNSINNAGIATMEWKEQMVEAAIAAGTLKKAGEDAYEAGGKTFTLQQLFIDGLQHQWATTDVMMKVFGDYGDEQTKIGKKAYSAAQDIKTFSQMMESLKATAGTGWKDTWQIIFGDLDEAKELWTGLSNFISGIITKFADFRNGVLGKVFNGGGSSKWDELSEKLNKAGLSTDKLKGASELLTGASDNLNKSLDKTGTYTVKKGDYLYKIAKEYGTTWQEIYKINQDIIDDPDLIYPDQVLKMPEVFGEMAKGVSELTDEQLKNKGYTKEQIAAYRELEKVAKESGMTVSELLDELSKPRSGRDLLVDTFKNFGNAISGVAKAIGKAWEGIFGEVDADKIAGSIYNILDALNRFSEKLVLVDSDTGKLNENGQKIQRTFKGIFAALDIVLTLVGGPLKIAFKVLTTVLSYFDMDILDLTANIGDVIVKFRDWIDSLFNFEGILDRVVPIIKTAAEKIKEWFAAIKGSESFQKFVSGLKNGLSSFKEWITSTVNFKKAFDKISSVIKTVVEKFRDWIDSLKESENLPKDIANGIVNGLGAAFKFIKKLFGKLSGGLSGLGDLNVDLDGNPLGKFIQGLRKGLGVVGQVLKELGKIILEKFNGFLSNRGIKEIPTNFIDGFVNGIRNGIGRVGEIIYNLGQTMLEKIKEILDIHSPSKKTEEVGQNFVQGLINGIGDLLSGLWELLKSIGSKAIEIIKGLDLGQVIAILSTVGFTVFLVNLGKALNSFSAPFESFSNVIDGFKNIGKDVSKVMKSISTAVTAKAIKDIAIAIAILAASVFALALLPPGKMWSAVGAIAALAVALGLLVFAISKLTMNDPKGAVGFVGVILSITGSLLLVVIALKVLEGIDATKLGATIEPLIWIIGMVAILIMVCGAVTNYSNPGELAGLGATVLLIAGAIAVMAYVFAKLATLPDEAKIWQGLGCIFALTVFVGALTAVTKLCGKGQAAGIGASLLAMSIALGSLAVLALMLSKVDWENEWGNILIATAYIALLGAMMAGMIAVVKKNGGKHADKIASSLLKISVAIGILTVLALLLSKVDWKNEWGNMLIATAFIAAFGGIIVGLIWATKLAGNKINSVGDTIIKIAGAIAIMALVATLLGMVDPDGLKQGLMAIGLLTIMVSLLILATSKAQNIIAPLIILTAAIAILSGVLITLTCLDPSKVGVAAVALGALIAVLALLVAATSKTTGSLGVLITMTVVVGLLGGVLFLLAKTPTGNALQAAGAMALVMIAMAGVLVLLTAIGDHVKKAMKGVLGLLGLSAALLVITVSLLLLKNVNNAVSSAVALTILIGAMTVVLGLLAIIEPIVKKAAVGAASLAIVSASLLVLVLALVLMSGVQNAVSSAIALGVLMGVMTAVLVVLSNAQTNVLSALTTVVSMIGLAAALVILAQALTMLGGMSLGQVVVALVALGGAFLIIGVAAFALQGVAPVIIALAAAFLLIGVGVVIAGVGLISVATGITALAAALTNGAPAIVTGITLIIAGLLGLIPIVMQQLTAMVPTIITFLVTLISSILTGLMTVIPTLIAFVTTLITSLLTAMTELIPTVVTYLVTLVSSLLTALTVIIPQVIEFITTVITSVLTALNDTIPLLVQTGVTLITSLLTAIQDIVPTIVETGVVIVTSLLEGLKTCIPMIVDAGLQIVTSILQGIADNIGDIIEAGTNVIMEFIKGVGEAAVDLADCAFTTMTDFINGLADVINNRNGDLIDAVDNLMDAVIGAIKDWFFSFTTKGGQLVEKLASGIKGGIERVKTAIGEIISGIKSKIQNKIEDLKQAGKNIIDGFINGIKAKIEDVKSAAADLGAKALASIKDFLGIESPSKEFAKIGRWSDEGLVKGLVAYSGKVAKAAKTVGSSALDPVKDAMSNVASELSNNVDSRPTIRPVLDLSDVRAGANGLNSLLNKRPSVGVLANVGAISSMMNGYGQNGNGDVVSAIDKLRKDMSNVDRATYQINGVTYDDGSNITDAVKTIVRAAKIDRRR